MSSDNSGENSTNKTVTYEDVLIVTQRVVKDSSVQVIDYDLSSYSANKLGFLGSHQQLKITFKTNSTENEQTLKLFVKSIPYDCPGQVTYINDEKVFVEECNFFKKIAPQLLESYKGEKWSPVCYLAKNDVLIMEDLTCQGYSLRASFYNSYAELQSAIVAIARLHACSIITETRHSRSSNQKITIKDLHPNSFNERVFKREGHSYRWIFPGINLVCIIGDRYGHNSHKLRKAFARLFELVKPLAVHRNVFCHGDLWTNNIMFDHSEPIPKCVLVDYQVCRYAPLALDILQLLYLHTSREFRNEHEEALVAFYHSILVETINSSDLANEMAIPTLQEVFAALKDLRLFGPAVACIYFPIVLMDPEIIKEKLKDADGFDNFLLNCKMDVTVSYMENNELFKSRFLEVIEELARASEDL